MTSNEVLSDLLADGIFTSVRPSSERVLEDSWNAESFSAHMAHDTYSGGTPQPETCDHCYVQPMLADIHAAWTTGTNETCEILWSFSDGYGEPGLIPEQGYDWSGIRDSTPAAIREMWTAIHA